MDAHSPHSAPPAAVPARPGMKRRWMYAVLAVTFLFVLMPFLFWQSTWFGRPLDDAGIAEALADPAQPRKIQHALSQLADRMASPDPVARETARRFYPELLRVATSNEPALRLTAAWVMGQDNTYPRFQEELRRLLRDPDPMVRRNAALALVRFGDLSGRDEIRAILAPYTLAAPRSGILSERLDAPEPVNPGTLVCRIQTGGEVVDVRSDVPGAVREWLVADGAAVTAGQPILLIDPSRAEVWEALRAIYLIGEEQDLAAVEQLARAADAPAEIRRQAEFTAQAIRARSRQANP